MRLIESSKDSLLKQQTNKGYTQNTVDRVYAAIRAMAEGSKTLKIQEIRDRLVPLRSAVKVRSRVFIFSLSRNNMAQAAFQKAGTSSLKRVTGRNFSISM
jgi:hypothetical protein